MKQTYIGVIMFVILVLFHNELSAQVLSPINVSQHYTEINRVNYAGVSVGFGFTEPIRGHGNPKTSSMLNTKAVLSLKSNLDWIRSEIYAENVDFRDYDGSVDYTMQLNNLGFDVQIDLDPNNEDTENSNGFSSFELSVIVGGFYQDYQSEYTDVIFVDDQIIWGRIGLVANIPIFYERFKHLLSVDVFSHTSVPVLFITKDDASDSMNYENFTGKMNFAIGFLIHVTSRFTESNDHWFFDINAGCTMNVLSGEDNYGKSLPQVYMIHFGINIGW